MENKKIIRDYLYALDNFRKILLSTQIKSKIPRGEMMVLDSVVSLADNGEKVTTSTLSKHMDISKPAVSQLINSAENKGWLTRTIDTVDKRVYCVHLTDEGKKIVEEVREETFAAAETILGKLDKEDITAVIRISEKCYKAVKEYIAENNS